MWYRLTNGANMEKIVADESKRDELISAGWALVEQERPAPAQPPRKRGKKIVPVEQRPQEVELDAMYVYDDGKAEISGPDGLESV